jgi:hypothetical protein
MTCFLINANGIAGLIDLLQFLEVFITAAILSIFIRIFKKSGLVYIMEWMSLAAGILWMIMNMLLLRERYTTLEEVMIYISVLSLWYGLIFSIFNSMLITIHIKNKEKRNTFYE